MPSQPWNSEAGRYPRAAGRPLRRPGLGVTLAGALIGLVVGVVAAGLGHQITGPHRRPTSASERAAAAGRATAAGFTVVFGGVVGAIVARKRASR